MNYIKLLRLEKELEKAIPDDLILYHNRAFIKDKKLKPGNLYYVEYFLTSDTVRGEMAVYIKDCTFIIYAEYHHTYTISFDGRYKLLNIICFDKQPSEFRNIIIDPNAKS